MVELNEQQIALISAYIKQHGIAQGELHDDLLDHVCTSIERLMDEGTSFDEAFGKTIKLFGPGGLKQVQQQTFELLTEMNETMKKITFTFGLTSIFLLLAGTIFKLMHWPGAGVMIVLGSGLLVTGYLPLVLYHKLKESPSSERLTHIAGYVGLTLTAIAALFKIQHWPGAAPLLLVGMGSLGFIYVPIYFYKKYKSSVNKPITLTTSLVAMSCLVILFALVSVNPSARFNWTMALTDESLTESNAKTSTENALYERVTDPRAEELKASVQRAYDYLDDLKAHLISTTDQISIEKARGMDAVDVVNKFNFDIPTHTLFGSAETSEFHVTNVLKTLKDFENEVLNLYDADIREDVKSRYPIIINDNYDYRGEKMNWGKYHFFKVPITSIVMQLSMYQSDIRSVETQTLLYLLSQPAASNPPSGG